MSIVNNKFPSHFKILSFECPSGLLSTSIQVIGKNSMNEPRIYEVLSDFDEDIEETRTLSFK